MGDLEILRIVTDVANELTIGEMRQLAAVDALAFTEDDYYELIRAKTASLHRRRVRERRAVRRAAHPRAAGASTATGSAWRSRSPTTFSTTPANESVTGKPGGLDLREHKVTLPLIAALPRVSRGGARADRRAVRHRDAGRRADRRRDRDRRRRRRHRLRAPARASSSRMTPSRPCASLPESPSGPR